MTNKEIYLSFSDKHCNLPLFLQPWWLDAVTRPDNKQWDVLLACGKSGEVEAVMPFLYGQKYSLRYILNPQLTQYTGVWITNVEGENIKDRLSREKTLQTEIIRQLQEKNPNFVELSFSPRYTYWLPFYWAGYSCEPHYTYRIESLSDTASVFDNFDYSKQKQIRKAESAGIVVDTTMTAEEFYALQCLQWETVGQRDILSKELVMSVISTAISRNQGMLFSAKDVLGTTHAALFVIWDAQSAYSLMSAIHPQYRSSGASTLMVWEAMKRLSTVTRSWDFEGSMSESVENSFRLFGAVPATYFKISKYSKMASLVRQWKR